MLEKREHAVVLGAGMGGLLAARVLSEHFDRVTVLDKDALPAGDAPRRGVPQGRHAHGILAAGLKVLEALFPGLREELVAAGGQGGDMAESVWIVGGERLALRSLGISGVSCLRPTLEGHVRRRLLADHEVRIRDRHDVLGLLVEDDRVVGVRGIDRTDGATEERTRADLVVDASGRGSRAHVWLGEHGFPAPQEQQVKIQLGYASALYRRRPDDLGGAKALIISAKPPNPRCGAALAVAPDLWLVTLMGYLGERAEPDPQGFLRYAQGLPAPDLHALLLGSEPCGDYAATGFSHERRRRYDRLDRHPEGFVVMGDALCSFNPIFGQGMSIAALEAEVLDRCLALGLSRVASRFYRQTRPLLDGPWSVVVGNDLRFSAVQGERSGLQALVNRYLDAFLRGAHRDPVLGSAFLRVAHLLDHPSALMRPSLLGRVLRATWAPQPGRGMADGVPTVVSPPSL